MVMKIKAAARSVNPPNINVTKDRKLNVSGEYPEGCFADEPLPPEGGISLALLIAITTGLYSISTIAPFTSPFARLKGKSTVGMIATTADTGNPVYIGVISRFIASITAVIDAIPE